MRVIMRMKGAGRVTYMGEKRNAYRMLLVKREIKTRI
jgi:hypothetical protein